MKLIESIYTTPEKMIEVDGQLLMNAESGEMGETLRFWAASEYFIVVGRASKVEEDCFLERCWRDDIKIIRRSSGGGTVLQGPGCLNYSAILSYKSNSCFRDVRESYKEILTKLSGAFKEKDQNVEFFPLSDLALRDRKISGNAQTRKRRFFLHHGTILFDFDLDKISYYLKHPPTEPEYRKGRPHKDFVANIPMAAEDIKEVIQTVFISLCCHPERSEVSKKRFLAVVRLRSPQAARNDSIILRQHPVH